MIDILSINLIYYLINTNQYVNTDHFTTHTMQKLCWKDKVFVDQITYKLTTPSDNLLRTSKLYTCLYYLLELISVLVDVETQIK